MFRRLLVLLGLAACIGLSTVAAPAQPYGGPRYAPPPPRYERHGRPPGRGYVWVGGYQRWSGHRYIWVAGGWRRPPHYGWIWHPGYYSRRGGIYIWIGGRWGPP
ncbi:MAG TPA: hypothetical protein VMF11_01935 [Candidatus Baltobacteraceae bacterium]|nr:hypothetical protein [Candidatus Baltobacteraceae bacterium]